MSAVEQPTVPEEAIEAAAKVLRCDYATQYDDTNVGWQEFADLADAALAAAVPVIEKQLRAEIADDLEGLRAGRVIGLSKCAADLYGRGVKFGLRAAARIVRGEQP